MRSPVMSRQFVVSIRRLREAIEIGAPSSLIFDCCITSAKRALNCGAFGLAWYLVRVQLHEDLKDGLMQLRYAWFVGILGHTEDEFVDRLIVTGRR